MEHPTSTSIQKNLSNCSAQGWIERATGEERLERVEQRHALLAQGGEVAA